MMRIMLADDHRIFREGLAQLLAQQEDVELVAQLDDGDALLAKLRDDAVDVVILDVSMPGPGATDICRAIAAEYPKTKVIILTMHQQAALAEQLLAVGAAAFVLKRSAFDELRDALAAVARGESYVSPTLAAELVSRSTRQSTLLSSREEDVAKLVAQGHTNQRIAALLSISVKTVETHRGRAMQKLGVNNSAEFVRRLAELGLLGS